jgi:hypothetical protein
MPDHAQPKTFKKASTPNSKLLGSAEVLTLTLSPMSPPPPDS